MRLMVNVADWAQDVSTGRLELLTCMPRPMVTVDRGVRNQCKRSTSRRMRATKGSARERQGNQDMVTTASYLIV